MLDTLKNMKYKAFGLSILSEIPMPELLNGFKDRMDTPDLIIEKSNIPDKWYELSTPNKKLIVKENLVMFEIKDIAIFIVENGNKIIVSPLKDYDEDIARIYLLGTCMGSLLMQRKVYPLHGSAIVVDGKAYAFVGDSGAGKSTLASAFLNHGYQLLSDDVIAISLTECGKPYVIPSYPQQKLWYESLKEFGMRTEGYKSIYGRETKYCVPISSNYHSEPIQLAGVFELVKSEVYKIEMDRIEKLNRFQILFSNTYRNYLVRQLELLEWHFNTSASILDKIDVYRIQRPTIGFTAQQLVSIILDTIKKEK